MIGFRGSNATAPSANCQAVARGRRQDNVAWTAAQAKALTSRKLGRTPASLVLLVGGVSHYDFRLRVAQSHLRADLTPSPWSHAALLMQPEDGVSATSELLESSLEPWEGFQVSTALNGLQVAPLSRYADPEEYPNVALIRVPADPAAWRDALGGRKSLRGQFANQRSVLDVPSLTLDWLGYVWCVGGAPNPLVEGRGIPSAAVIESLIGGVGYDISPGIDTSASSPEALWQTAQWWQEYFEDMTIEQMHTRYHQSESMPGPRPAAAGSATGQRFGRG